MKNLLCTLTVMGVTVLSGAVPLWAGGDKQMSKEEKELFQKAEAFVKTFNAGDAKALAAFWAEGCDYVSQQGQVVKGRKAMEEIYRKYFAEKKGAKLRINIISVRILKPDLAVEDGVTQILHADGGPPLAARYTIIHAKKDGEWRLSSLREAAPISGASSAELRGLDRLIGSWTDTSEKGEAAKVSFAWAENQQFIVASIATTMKDIPVASETQWIGWDAAAKQIRSCSFDSRGGMGEGTWAGTGKEWRITTTAKLPDGKKVVGTTILSLIGDGTLSWRSVSRSVDGRAVPDAEAIKLQRVK